MKAFLFHFHKFMDELIMMNNGKINLLNFDENPVAANIYLYLEVDVLL
jgi:hypothetical protein